MANRYCVTNQGTITDGTGTCTGSPKDLPIGDNAVVVSVVGTFTVFLASGTSGHVHGDATCLVTDDPYSLVAGTNTVTTTGEAGTITVTLASSTTINWNDVNTWSAATGGVAGASVPTSADNAYFDAASFPVVSTTLTINAAAVCLDMDWTGATNTPTIAGAIANKLDIYGSLTLIDSMNYTANGAISFLSTTTGKTVTTVGKTLSTNMYFSGVAGGWTLQDSLTLNVASGKSVGHTRGTLNTNNQNVTCGLFEASTGYSSVVTTLGSSTINCTSWTSVATGHTLNANTSTIKVTGTGAFSGGGQVYNNVELNGTAHTISGNNTFASLVIATGAVISFTDGSIQIVTTFAPTGTSGSKITLTGTSTAGWTISKASGTVTGSYLIIRYSTATGGASFYAIYSTNSGGNSGWIWLREGTQVHRMARLIGAG